MAALLRHTNRVIYLDDGEVAVLQPDTFRILSISQELVHRDPVKVEWQVEETEKNGFPHFMLKEIFEQPETVLNAFRGRVLREEGVSKFGGLDGILPELKKINRLVMISCGTSYHAGLLGRYIFEKLTDINVDVEIASEFRYRNINLSEGTAVLAISQSGETADTIAAVREARRKGALALGLVNVVGSTIARETIAGVYNHAGPEIGVASTKIFTSQVVILEYRWRCCWALQKVIDERRHSGAERHPEIAGSDPHDPGTVRSTSAPSPATSTSISPSSTWGACTTIPRRWRVR